MTHQIRRLAVLIVAAALGGPGVGLAQMTGGTCTGLLDSLKPPSGGFTLLYSQSAIDGPTGATLWSKPTRTLDFRWAVTDTGTFAMVDIEEGRRWVLLPGTTLLIDDVWEAIAEGIGTHFAFDDRVSFDMPLLLVSRSLVDHRFLIDQPCEVAFGGGDTAIYIVPHLSPRDGSPIGRELYVVRSHTGELVRYSTESILENGVQVMDYLVVSRERADIRQVIADCQTAVDTTIGRYRYRHANHAYRFTPRERTADLPLVPGPLRKALDSAGDEHAGSLRLVLFRHPECLQCDRAATELGRIGEQLGDRAPTAYWVNPFVTTRDTAPPAYPRLSGIDETTLRDAGVRSFPTTALVDHSGRVVWWKEGYDRQYSAELFEVVTAWTAGERRKD